MDFIGFGRETSPGASVAPKTIYFPFRTSDEEICEECGTVRPRAEMEFFGSDADGVALYRCR